ncbi:MAG: DUF5606 domain-containing protein [Bacteroidales bacterium]|nr:DUF5606 domain-containing protein [Bacteroidales bacterium]MCF8375592.1 DUF5606 domain-containing protein [Bacteroidales bacterium]
MDLKDILAIAGKPGLYKMKAQTKAGVVVESLIDGKKFTAFEHERISSLEEISIYTETEDMPLKDVFKAIYEKQNGEKAIDPKSSGQELKDFMLEVVPDYDEERVYTSDIKKLVRWYNILQEKDMLDFSEEEEEEKKEEEQSKVEESEKQEAQEKEKEPVKPEGSEDDQEK